MALPAQKLRELVFEILFSFGFHESSHDEIIALLMRENKVTKNDALTAMKKALAIQNLFPELDERISKASSSFRIERIGASELAILRLCIYELIHEKTAPIEVYISEGKRLTAKFASEKASAFVHGVLSKVLEIQEG